MFVFILKCLLRERFPKYDRSTKVNIRHFNKFCFVDIATRQAYAKNPEAVKQNHNGNYIFKDEIHQTVWYQIKFSHDIET